MAFVAFALGRTGEGWSLLDWPQINDLLPLRWPRLLAAAAAGGLLALTGTTLQRLTGNPMASPELPLGLFAALAGAPYLIWLIGRQKTQSNPTAASI